MRLPFPTIPAAAALPGVASTFKVRVRNFGFGAAGAFQVRAYLLSSATGLPTTAPVLGTVNVNGLASLATVDLVAVFEEDTPTELIRLVRPDVLVKGADYTVDQVVGGDLVQEWGGEVKLAELLPGNSTTATVARIKG